MNNNVEKSYNFHRIDEILRFSVDNGLKSEVVANLEDAIEQYRYYIAYREWRITTMGEDL